jgi:hypothetical protein
MFNFGVLVAYNLPMMAFSMHWNRWPADVQKRPYFTQGICGPGTTTACPSPGVPIAKMDPRSARIGPDGTIVGRKESP